MYPICQFDRSAYSLYNYYALVTFSLSFTLNATTEQAVKFEAQIVVSAQYILSE